MKKVNCKRYRLVGLIGLATILVHHLAFSALQIKAVSPAPIKENYRFIVSAGTLTAHYPFSPFFRSRIFIGDDKPALTIINANAMVFETDDAVFYAPVGITKESLINAKANNAKGVVHFESVAGFIGQSFRGFLLEGVASEELRQSLGADPLLVHVDRRHINNVAIIGMSKTANSPISWPKSIDELQSLPAVVIADKKSSSTKYLVAARLVGDLTYRLGLIDRLKNNAPKGTPWLDLGTNHGLVAMPATDQLSLINLRKPSAVLLGTYEMSSMIVAPKIYSALPAVFPFDKSFKQIITDSSGTQINLWSLSGAENLWPLYSKLGTRVAVQEALALMREEASKGMRRINIVRAFSEEAAIEAAKSVYVDLVLLLAKDPYAQLPTSEITELTTAKSDAHEQIAPIVRLSYLDVSEVKIFGPSKNVVQRIEVARYGINDSGPRASDILRSTYQMNTKLMASAATSTNSSHVWERPELQKVVSGMLLEQTHADIAIVTELPLITPIAGPMPQELVKNLASIPGGLALITTTGRQVKTIGKLIKDKRLTSNLNVYGADLRAGKIGDRIIVDNERFTIAVSEDALLELFSISRLGGLGESYAIRAPFIEQINASPSQLFYVAGPKVMAVTDTAVSLEQAVDNVRTSESFATILDRGLAELDQNKVQKFINGADGEPHHVLTFDINYLDVGLSKNFTNDTYRSTMKNFPISRGNIPVYAHLFIYSKMSLNHDAPFLQTSLFNEIKYMHTNFETKPEKDKVKIGLKFRLPWERSLFRDSSVIVAPIFRNTYETKLAPNFWTNNHDLPKRTRRIDTMLGVNIDFTKLGFNVDIGGLMVSDFNRFNVNDAIDLGPGFNFYSRWNLFGPLELSSEILSGYYFALPKNQVFDKLALGVEGSIWLRFARVYDFSIAAVSDFLIATLHQSPKQFALSSIFGFTVSYGRLFRLFG